MIYRAGSVDISGLAVDVYLTDEDDYYELPSEEGRIVASGKYDVDKCRIWLDIRLAPTRMRMQLYHEVMEFLLGLYHVSYYPGYGHDSFTRFGYMQYAVLLANRDVLFGDLLMEWIRNAKATDSERGEVGEDQV